jgi:hypothetical protein
MAARAPSARRRSATLDLDDPGEPGAIEHGLDQSTCSVSGPTRRRRPIDRCRDAGINL